VVLDRLSSNREVSLMVSHGHSNLSDVIVDNRQDERYLMISLLSSSVL